MTNHSRRLGALVWLGALAAAGATRAIGNDDILIDASSGPSCRKCSIELTRVVSLGRRNDAEFPTFRTISTVVRDRAGGYVVKSGSSETSILVYGPTGSLLRTLGRAGGGPGEYRSIDAIAAGLADSVLVYHSGLRLTVLTPELQFGRIETLPEIVVGLGVPFPDGSMMIPYLGHLPPRPGLPLHMVSPDGQFIRSFGAEHPQIDPRCAVCSRRFVTASVQPGTFWSHPINAYVLEKWDTAGKLERRISVIGSPWFRSWADRSRTTASPLYVRPVPELRSLFEDQQRRLWVTGVVAAADWHEEAPPEVRLPTDNRGRLPAEHALPRILDGKYTTQVDVLDPASRRVVATARFEHVVLHDMGDGYFYSIREDPTDGFAILDIWRLQLVG
jgi:hypothetical protein